jgi:ubiquinone/menaquinone biosynthesis C-methylase UbiE
MTMTFTGKYPIESRDGEIERLIVQGETMAPDTQNMLARIGVGPGWNCLDLGCGPQGITHLLSDAVGETGSVVGLDMDEDFLDYARASAPENVSFQRGDAFASRLPDESFDMVHARFLACTAGEPQALLAEAMRLCRPSGVIAMQESDLRTLNAYPPHPAFDRLRDMMIGAFRDAGAHPTLAHDLYAMAKAAGLLDVCYRPFVVGVRSTDPVVDYLPSTVESMRKTVLRLGLATEATLAADLEACRGHLRRPETVFTLFTVVQVWGRKAAN